jgi:Protein of unknown function (DUF2281)
MPEPRTLIEKLQSLPPERLQQVEDFVDFLTAKTRRQAALDQLLAIADRVAEAGIPPMSMEEITAEVKAARAERRQRHPG